MAEELFQWRSAGLGGGHSLTCGRRYLAEKMAEELFAMPLDEALPILRAFGHYLK